ncbi:MAG: hypothetical protein IPO09_20390 [Anaeromyxobacter sp.]|nr:hypothetical protein [Anaeromyxobacter sp.]MBL0274850.1 hypothetical protein [Anaeromyxobacter sp.]
MVVAVAVAGICALFAGSVALLARLDRPDEPSDPGSGLTPTAPPPAAAWPPPPELPGPLERVSPQVLAAQLRSPPSLPAPAPPEEPLPPAGVPPPPRYVYEIASELEAQVSRRCGTMELRLGEALRRSGLDPEGHAVLLVEAEPQEGQLKLWRATLQAHGRTSPGQVACCQFAMNGLTVPVRRLQAGERFQVQVVVGNRRG